MSKCKSCLQEREPESFPDNVRTWVEINIKLDEHYVYVTDNEGKTTKMELKENGYPIDTDDLELLEQLTHFERIRIPAFSLDGVRYGITNNSDISFLFECIDEQRKNKGKVSDEPMKVQTQDMLHFQVFNGDLYIRSQPDSNINMRRLSEFVLSSDSDEVREVFNWCEVNSPLFINNRDSIYLLRDDMADDEFCYYFLRDLRKEYKKPITTSTEKPSLITPKPRYRMTFYYGGTPRTFIHHEPCYFIRYEFKTDSYDMIIGAPYEPVALPTNGEKYVILSPCTVEELQPVWSIEESHHGYDYNLEYNDGKVHYKMGINNRDDSRELVNWFLEHQPELKKEQLESIFSAKWDSGLKLFKAMYK